jgi:hypothetical protein
VASSEKTGNAVLAVVGALIALAGVVLAVLFGVSGYFMMTRPVQPAGVDAQPTAALVVGIAFALGVILAGVWLLRRALR